MKALLVKESLKFERNIDPKKSMDIGKNFNNPFYNNPEVFDFYEYSQRQDSPFFEKTLDIASEIFGVDKNRILSAKNPFNRNYMDLERMNLIPITPEIGYRFIDNTIQIINAHGTLLWTLGTVY